MRITAAVVFVVLGAMVSGCGSSRSSPDDPGASAKQPSIGVAIGDLAPDFLLDDSTGNAVRLSQFRGKVVLLEFSAMW